MEYGLPVSIYEIDGSLDVTVVVVVSALVVEKCVVVAGESTLVEGYFICPNKYCY